MVPRRLAYDVLYGQPGVNRGFNTTVHLLTSVHDETVKVFASLLCLVVKPRYEAVAEKSQG